MSQLEDFSIRVACRLMSHRVFELHSLQVGAEARGLGERKEKRLNSRIALPALQELKFDRGAEVARSYEPKVIFALVFS